MASIPSLSLFDGKVCSSCGQWKPFSDFHKAKGYHDGYTGQCKPCRRVVILRWHAHNRAQNGEQLRAKQKAWYAQKGIAYHQEWRSKNRERLNALNRARYAADPSRNIHHALRRSARRRGAGGSHTLAEWEALKAKFDHRCVCCWRKVTLTQDHILPISHGGTDNIENIQPLCGICNSRKNNRFKCFRPDRMLPP